MNDDRTGLVRTVPQERKHVLALDGVRGAAIILVLARHLSLLKMGTRATDPIPDRMLHAIASVGWVGVDLFFVLSGYLITGILLEAKNHESVFKWFWFRRALRIFPLYYLTLFFLFIVAPHVWPLAGEPTLPAFRSSWPWYVAYVVNYRPSSMNLFNTGHFWSLAVEEQFYVVWPVVVLLASRRTLWNVTVSMLVAALAVRVWLVLYSQFGIIAAYTFAPARMDVLAAGALVALCATSTTALSRTARYLPWIGLGSLVLVVCLAIIGSHGFANENPWIATLGYSAIAAIGATLIFLVVHQHGRPRWIRAFESKPLRSFGKYSYCLYVVHYPLFMAVEPLVSHAGVPHIGQSEILIWLAIATLVIGNSFAIAWISWRFFEGPLNNLKRLIVLGPPEQPEA